MGEFSFNETDKQKFVEFLNMVAKCATFEMKTDEVIAYFKLIAHMQQSILPKINANILEIIKVEESKELPPAIKESKTSKNKV